MKTKLLIVFAFCTFNLFSQTNLVPNNGFETWTNSTTLSNWTIENSVTQNTSSYTEGSKSAQLSIANSTTKPKITILVPMSSGITYTVKFKYKYVSANYNGQHPISLNISQNGSATTLSSSTFATNNNWTVKETTFTPDQNLSYDLSISLYTFDAAAFNVLIDDVQVYVQGTEQYTTIPDVNFENKLIALGIDSGVADGKVLTNSINKLTTLDVSSSSIADLTGIQDFVGLTTLRCYGNQLTAINVSKNTALNTLVTYSNALTSIDVSTNLALNHLECDSNRLTALDVSLNLALKHLECQGNRLTTLDISKNVALTNFYCYNNQLTTLDVTKNIALISFTCANNLLTSLDVSKNVALTSFYCNSNKLLSLNLKNGKNTLLTNGSINLTDNAGLTCIVVDNTTYSNTNWGNKKDTATFFSPLDCSLVTKIPDTAFEDKLIALGIDTDGKNGLVTTASITTVTTLDVSNSSIADLTGIQAFTALTTLNCSGNLLKKLDVSKNTAISILNCSNNPTLICIQVADVAATANWVTTKDATAGFNLDCTIYTLIPDAKFEDKLIALGIDKGGKNGKVATESISMLTGLDVSNSSITNLTGIQDFVGLTYLECSNNQLTSLDVTKNIALTNLECNYNNLTTLDLSNNVALASFRSYQNQLTALDITKNVALTSLYCQSNQLTSLDISKNIALITLYCNNNKLTTLDASKNVTLTDFFCSTNNLSSLNLKNGKNNLLTNTNLNFTENPNLICIVVDDVAYANTNWTNRKDSFAFYSPYDCSTITKIPDGAFEDKLIALGIDTDGKNGVVLNTSITALTSLDVSNSSITDLTGIQGFTALTTLNCLGNLLKKLDLSKNTAFTTLNCSNNPSLICIQVADVAATANWVTTKDATASFNLDCTIYTLIPDAKFEDKLIALGIDKDGKNGKVATESISKLTSVNVSSSSITDLTGIKDFTALTTLNCYSNLLTTLDISKNIALEHLECDSNQLTSLDISKNVALTYIECQYNKLTTIDISKNPALTTFKCSSNLLTTLDVSTNVALTSLDCSTNQLATLDVSKNVALTNFNCYSNLLTTLDVSKNVALNSFYCSTNKLSNLNLKNGKNTLLTNGSINLTDNAGLTCILVDDVVYSNTNWANKKDTATFFSPLDCSLVTKIPDTAFEDKLIALGIDTDGKNGLVTTASIATVTTLDVSNSSIADLTGIQAFTALTTLNCSGNLLKKLDVSKNTAISILNCSNNPTLICIQVADVAAAANWVTTKDAIANFNLDCTIYTLIPDAKFEDKLIALGIDKDGKNGKVATESIATLTSLNVSSSSIANLAGIQDFKALTLLKCYSNQLTTLDVSKNTALTYLECDSNKLATLDVSKNVALTFLECEYNQLVTLDVSKNLALTTLYSYSNQLTSLDISKNVALTYLNCNSNNLKSLNLKNGKNTLLSNLSLISNPSLSCIQVDDIAYSNTNWATKKDATASYSSDCAYSTIIPDSKFEDKLIALGIDTDGKNGKVLTANITNLTSLDVSNATIADLKGIEDFTFLENLSCDQNLLTKIDLTKNLYLVSLSIANNKLTMLNVVNNTKLQTIHCNDNLLRTLDFSKNTSLTEIYCPNNKLISLNLKNGNNAVSNGPSIKNFTNNPDLSCIQVDDVTYSNTNWPFYKDATANYSSDCAYSTAIPDPKFEDKLIALGIDTDGKNGKVATANIIYVTDLDVSGSSIENLTGIQDFASLKNLNCKSNLLSSIDVSKNADLITLNCYSNDLLSIDVSKNTNLTSLNLDFNETTNLNVANNLALTSLSLYYNKITALDISKNISLTYLNCDGNTLTSLDVSKNVALTYLSSSYNKLTSLDVSKNKALKTFSCGNNNLTTLDVSNNIALTILNCSYNKLQTLNLKNGKNTLIEKSYLSLSGNTNLYCILVDDVTYSNANWTTNKDTTASFNNVECIALSLSSNNFTVESKGETCTGSNNGEINITGTATYAYKAKINAGSYTFTNNSLKVPNLAPGTYMVSITIPGETFEQSFTVIIPKGATITGKSSVVANKVSVEITEGTAPYTVFVDGVEQFETTDSSFSVDTKKGGLLQVKTAKACEGIYAKEILVLKGAISAYPNPTSGSFEIELPTTKKEVVINLYTLDGQMISTKTYTIENGKAQLSLENQPSGVYIAKIELDTPDYLKILKN